MVLSPGPVVAPGASVCCMASEPCSFLSFGSPCSGWTLGFVSALVAPRPPGLMQQPTSFPGRGPGTSRWPLWLGGTTGCGAAVSQTGAPLPRGGVSRDQAGAPGSVVGEVRSAPQALVALWGGPAARPSLTPCSPAPSAAGQGAVGPEAAAVATGVRGPQQDPGARRAADAAGAQQRLCPPQRPVGLQVQPGHLRPHPRGQAPAGAPRAGPVCGGECMASRRLPGCGRTAPAPAPGWLG